MPNLLYLNVVLDPITMKLQVNGNIMRNKVTALGMLELAREAVLEFIPEEKSDIVVPDLIPPTGIGKG